MYHNANMSVLNLINCNNDPENYKASESRTFEKVPLFYKTHTCIVVIADLKYRRSAK